LGGDAEVNRSAPRFDPDSAVTTAIELLRRHYVLTERVQSITDALDRRLRGGAYRDLRDIATFADVLTDDLRTLSGDGHLSVRVRGHQPQQHDTEEWAARERRRATEYNLGFLAAEVLAGNVGYLRIAEFMEPQATLATASAAMRFLANTHALILDLRGNPGGYGGIPECLATFFFPEGPPVLLSTFEYRPEKSEPVKTYTLPAVSGQRRVGIALYVLVDKTTASAAEWLAYTLQGFRKAQVVGEPSAGGAHSNEYFDLYEQLQLSISTGVPVSAATGGSWEGTGVIPDIRCEPTRAVEVARSAIVERDSLGA
jgi:C-terminal processing protease CtpA/Prc